MPALIALGYFSLLVLGLLDNIRGPFFPEIVGELHLSGTTGSAFFAVTSLFAFIGSWSSHSLLSKRSSTFLLGISSLGLALGFAAVSRAPTYLWLLPACAFFGYFFGALNLAQNMIVCEAGPPHLRRRLLSGLHSMYGLAALLAPLAATAFRHLGCDWRQSFLCLAVLPVVVSVAAARPRAQAPAGLQTPPSLARGEWTTCLLVALMMAAYLWGEISVSTRFVLWLRTDMGFVAEKANLYLAGFFLLLLSGRAIFTFLHMRHVNNWTVLWASALSASVLYFLGLNLSPVWLVLSGLAMAPFFPVAMDQINELFGDKSAQAVGFVLGFGSLSVVVMHMVIGKVSDLAGLTLALHVGPISLVAVALALTYVKWFSIMQAHDPSLR